MIKCKKTILIPLETISRELDYKVFISMFLAYEGFNVVLGKKQYINYLITKYHSFIYLDKGYHEGISDNLYMMIKSRNGFIINLDEEGAVDFPDMSTLQNRYSKNMIKSVDKVFLWGKNQKKMILNSNINFNNLVVTGHPRFHLMKKNFFGLYESDVRDIKKKYKNFILINTNFGFGNNIKGDDHVIKNYSNRFKNIELIIKEDKLKFKLLVSLVKKISKNHDVIIRPHPEELLYSYQKKFNNNSKVKIKREKSSIPWIIASKACIHMDCTTGIEAAILGKKVISFVPMNLNKKLLTELPLKVSEIYSNSDEILKSLNATQKKPFNNKILDNYFSLDLDINFFLKQFNLLKNKNDFNSYFSKNLFSEFIFYFKLIVSKILRYINIDPLEKSKLNQYNKKFFYNRYAYYKKENKILSGVKMIKKRELYYFTYDKT